jgi:hypothetical protein
MYAWAAPGTDFRQSTTCFGAGGISTRSGTFVISNTATTTGIFGFFRWYSGLARANQIPPKMAVDVAERGDALNIEFNDSVVDTSPQAIVMTGGGTLNYDDLPIYPPSCISPTIPNLNSRAVWFNTGPTLRAGRDNTLDGSASSPNNGLTALNYAWSVLSGPSPGTWSNQGTATPILSGLVAGEYIIGQTVTDSSGQSRSCQSTHGVVAVNASDVVIPSSADQAAIIGQKTRFGTSPWPYLDDSQKGIIDWHASKETTDWVATWNVPLSGTVSISNGSTAVTGVGTNFQTIFCSGGTTWDGVTYIVFHYVRSSDAAPHRRLYGVAACPSQTSLTLSSSYSQETQTAIPYGRMTNADIGPWIGGGGNYNYYDSVVAFYGLYQRTGLTYYRDKARALADAWFTHPYWDGGTTCSDGVGSLCPAPRVNAWAGQILRALDGKPLYFNSLRARVAQLAATQSSGSWLTNNTFLDLRENSYETAAVALMVAYDTTNPSRSTLATQLAAIIANYKAAQITAPSGQKYWRSITFEYGTQNGHPGTVEVQTGSDVVTITGGNSTWTTGCHVGVPFYSYLGPMAEGNGDTAKHFILSVSAGGAVLDRPYAGGQPGSGKRWQCSDYFTGLGIQPFIIGIAGFAMRHSAEALTRTGNTAAAADSRQMAKDAMDWLRVDGYRPASRGAWYGRHYLPCEPIGEGTHVGCIADEGSFGASREFLLEAVGQMWYSYLNTPDATTLTFMESAMGAIWGRNGGPSTDSDWARSYDPVSTGGDYRYKYVGFCCGVGSIDNALAARVGGVGSLDTRSIAIPVDPAAAAAGSVRVILNFPSGATETCTRDTAGMCVMSGDGRQGDHQITREYWSGAGATGRRLASSSVFEDVRLR